MKLIFVLSVLAPFFIIVILLENVPKSEAIYAYAVKGLVQDVRHNPALVIGGWLLKKAIYLKKLKIFFLVRKKLKLKWLAKKVLFNLLIGRKKRSLDEIEIPENLIPQISDNDIMPYFSMASEFDTNGCLPRSICEAMARGNRTHEMNNFERTVAEDLTLPRPEDTSSPSFVYEYAAYYGRTTRDEKACGSLFSNCQEPSNMLNKFMDETFVNDICQGPDRLIPQESYIGTTHGLYEEALRLNEAQVDQRFSSTTKRYKSIFPSS